MSTKEMKFADKMVKPEIRIPLYDLFNQLNKERTITRRVKVLKEYNERNHESGKLLRDYLQALYHPMVKLDLPDVPPPFKSEHEAFSAPLSLLKALSKVKYFVKSHSEYISNVLKRETTYIQILEGMSKDDADLYVSLLLKQFDTKKYPKLNIKTFYEAVPEYFVGIDVEEIYEKETAKK